MFISNKYIIKQEANLIDFNHINKIQTIIKICQSLQIRKAIEYQNRRQLDAKDKDCCHVKKFKLTAQLKVRVNQILSTSLKSYHELKVNRIALLMRNIVNLNPINVNKDHYILSGISSYDI